MNKAYSFIKNDIFNQENICELIDRNSKTLNISGFEAIKSLAKLFNVDIAFCRSSYQDYRKYLALGLFSELVSFDPNQEFVVAEDYFVLPLYNILCLLIKTADLVSSHGRTKKQIDEEKNFPPVIHLVLTSDGAKAQNDSTMLLTALRIIDSSIANKYKKCGKKNNETLYETIQSTVGVLLISILKGSDNKENNYKQNATNLEYAQKFCSPAYNN